MHGAFHQSSVWKTNALSSSTTFPLERKSVPHDSEYTPPNEMPPAPIHPVLVGQKALVTGASKGLGQAMAIGFAQAGADVLVNYSSDEQGAKETAKGIKERGRKAVVFKANQSRESEVKAMFECMFKTFGR